MKNKNTQDKKILLFTESLGSGGAERQLVGLAISLKNCGYNVHVLTYIENQFYEPLLRKHEVDYTLCKSEGNKFLRLFHVAREVSRIKPDTVISFLSSSNQMMCLLKPMGFRLIVSERNATTEWGWYQMIAFWLYRRADVIVANSEYEAENIKTHKPAIAQKTTAITNFVDTDYFVPFIHPENAVPVILCVGRITEQKNVLQFIDVVEALKKRGQKFVVKWFGAHDNVGYCSKVYEKVKVLGLQDVFHIHKPNTNILHEYQQADIFCLPSLHEGYPNVMCEAMSCELPIACSNVCENPNIVHDGVNGFLFDPDDIGAMANALDRILNMSLSELKAMGKKNRKQMIANNSIETFCKKYVELF